MSATLESYVNHTDSVITADGRQIVVDDLIDLYREYANVPVPDFAHLYDEHKKRNRSLRLSWKIRDMDTLEITSFIKHYSIQLSKHNQIKHISIIGDSIQSSNELAIAHGIKYKAVVRKGAKDSESGKTKQWLEIWNKNTKLKSIDIDDIEEHGNIILDAQFSSFKWSHDQSQLLYVSEYKYPKAQSFYKKKTLSEGKDNKLNEDKCINGFGEEFTHKEDWGEALDGIHHTIVCILDRKSLNIRTVQMKGFSIGTPFWIGTEKIGFVAWNEDPQRLGLVYCINRKSSIYTMDLNNPNAVPELLCGGDNMNIRSPRINPNGTDVIYLSNESGGAHFKACQLINYNFKTKTKTMIIDTKHTREILSDGDNGNIYGKPVALFIDELPHNCFTSDGKYVILNNISEVKKCLCVVSLQSKTLNVINFPMDSATLLDIKDNIMIVVGSSLNSKPNVYVGIFDENNLQNIKWTKVEDDCNDAIPEVTFESFSVPCGDDSQKLLHSILISPKSAENSPSPTVILPHGGPHLSVSITFLTYPILFAKLGLKTLMVNYRGSIGVDDDYVNTLCGRIGEMDVKDVMTCVTHLIQSNLIDSTKLVLFGGSHGGFLVTQLSGQFASVGFKSCICRNPVVDVAGMCEGTDIPDWNYTEALGLDKPYQFTSVANPNILKIMFEKSPFNWIDKVKVPTLMMLGSKDRRVPHTQGLKYYRALKARGIETKCHIYDDKHDLGKVNVDGDAFIHIALWILKHLNN